MKFSRKQNQTRQRGSILVICMVLAGLGTIGVAAWASLLDARTHEAEHTATSLDRRVKYGNSLGLAREVIYQKYLHANRGPAADDETYSLAGDWGLVQIDAWAEPVLGFDAATRVNKTGAVPFRAFSLDVDVSIDDGDYVHDFTYQLKSYSPLLGGDLVTVHKNVETGSELVGISGDLDIKGRANLWNADYQSSTMTARADSVLAAGKVLPKLSFKDTDNADILPSNFPFVAQTSGAVGGVADLSGKLNVVNNTGTPSNSYISKIQGYGPNTYTVVDANGVVGYGDGEETNPATADESTVAGIILAGGYSPANLAPYAPLSSANLNAVIADAALSSADTATILAANQPIPDDIIGPMLDTPKFSAAQEKVISDSAGWHVIATNGSVSVNLSSTTIPHLILSNVGKVEFIGQPDDATADSVEDLEPRIFVINNASGVELRQMNFSDQNKRRIIIAAHNDGTAANHNVETTFYGALAFPEWHVLFDLEGLRTKWDTSATGGARLFGGIRTDQLVDVVSGNLTIREEPNVDVLETMASRTAWIETIRK